MKFEAICKRKTTPTNCLASVFQRTHNHDPVSLAPALRVGRNVGADDIARATQKILEVLPLDRIRQVADVQSPVGEVDVARVALCRVTWLRTTVSGLFLNLNRERCFRLVASGQVPCFRVRVSRHGVQRDSHFLKIILPGASNRLQE
jgi:hypothetical protein